MVLVVAQLCHGCGNGGSLIVFSDLSLPSHRASIFFFVKIRVKMRAYTAQEACCLYLIV